MFYIDGKFVPDEEAKISVLDLGLVRGYGVFDYLRTYQGRPFHLKDHLVRLKFSAEQIGIELPLLFEEIEVIINTLLIQNGYPESSIKILLTGGISSDQMLPQTAAHLMILVHPLKPLIPIDYQKGIITTTTSLMRSLPTAKTLQYTPAIIALQKGRSYNAKEALYLNVNNEILEATTSNFFGFTQEGTLVTCGSDEILLGITREIVINLAKTHFPIEIRPISYKELPQIKECFITSSNKEILPVIQIDHHSIGSGQVGPFTQKLIHLFSAYTNAEQWPDLHISRYK